MFRRSTRIAATGIAACALATVSIFTIERGSGSAQTASPVMAQGYQVSMFAAGTSAYSNPDSVEPDTYLGFVYVGYQNQTAKDGTDTNTSTVVQYSMDGKVVRTFSVPGHNDGLRVDPQTHLVWASSNEDGNPVLTVINPISGAESGYTFPPTPHGGGYDDMAFANGKVYIAASNPTLDANGVNVYPALDEMQPMLGNVMYLRPVIMGNETATDTTTNQSVTLNEVDPDSLTVDPQGDVVLDNQAGSELVFLHNPGTPQQTLTRVPLGTQVDDTVWATASSGRLLVADASTNTIWQITGSFAPGTVYTEAPNDSGVASFVATLDLSSGTLTPVGIGFKKPTGLAFVPGK